MRGFVILAVEPFAEFYEAAAFCYEELAGFPLYEFLKLLALIAKLGFGDHVSAIFRAENIEIIEIRAQAGYVGILERVKLCVVRQGDHAHTVFLKDILGRGVFSAGFIYMLRELLCRAV